MFGYPWLDVTTGLIGIYAVLALVCATANELCAGMSGRREKHLRAGIANLLGEQSPNAPLRRDAVSGSSEVFPSAVAGVVEAFYRHPQITSLAGKGRRPSHIPDTVFADVILGIFSPVRNTTYPPARVSDFVSGVTSALPANSDLRHTLLILAEDAGGDSEKLRSGLVAWFSAGMERVAGCYRNQTQLSLLLISFLICLALNADSIRLGKELYGSHAGNAVFSRHERTDTAVVTPGVATVRSLTSAAPGRLRETGLTWGWGGDLIPGRFENRDLANAGIDLFGILFTALMAALGAPFWFGMLRKINVTSAGRGHLNRDRRSSPSPGGGTELRLWGRQR